MQEMKYNEILYTAVEPQIVTHRVKNNIVAAYLQVAVTVLLLIWRSFIYEEITERNVHKSGKSS